MEKCKPALILVVEDDPGIRTLETELIEDQGHEVIHAADGGNAFDVLKHRQPDLMLLDYSLPDMTGVELIDRINDSGLILPPFIVATGAGDEYVAVDLMQRGAYHYLVKDQEFLDRLPQVIERTLREIEMEHRLAEAEAKLRLAALVIETTTEAMFVTNEKQLIIDVNPAFERITGYPREEVLGRTPKHLLPGFENDQAVAASVIEAVEAKGNWQGEIQFRRTSGDIFTAWLNVTCIPGDDNQPPRYVTLFSDISSVKASAERLDYLAHHDLLTGLPNRLLLHARLAHSVERAQRAKTGLGLLFIDLDHFKEVNDQLGHAAGDNLLQTLSIRMSDLLRDEDTLARLGGDEFVILVEDAANEADLRRVVDLIISLFPHIVDTPQGPINVTASIGGALFPATANTTESLLAAADGAMYAAKSAGRNTFVLADC
jgi:diguanylate cyclase (GGDEF)-like protein/PAS domain S-box-containing protein